MQPQNNPQMGFNLPPAMPEQLPPMAPNQAPFGMPEAGPSSPELTPLPTPPGAVPMPQMTALPQAPTIQSVQTPVAIPTTNSVVPNVTHDTDLIEKEWVTKAMKIVEDTKEDPFKQSKDLTHLKADYMQKRYNKVIKLGE